MAALGILALLALPTLFFRVAFAPEAVSHGTYISVSALPSPGQPFTNHGDLDGDLHQDTVYGTSAPGDNGHIEIRLSRSPVTRLVLRNSSGIGGRVLVKDVDRDGDTDLVAPNFTGDTWILWRNNGQGDFARNAVPIHFAQGGYLTPSSPKNLLTVAPTLGPPPESPVNGHLCSAVTPTPFFFPRSVHCTRSSVTSAWTHLAARLSRRGPPFFCLTSV